MTKTVSELRKEYPKKLSSGVTEWVKVVLPKFSKKQLKDGYNLLCEGSERGVPPIVSRAISERLKFMLGKKSAENSASLIPRGEGR